VCVVLAVCRFVCASPSAARLGLGGLCALFGASKYSVCVAGVVFVCVIVYRRYRTRGATAARVCVNLNVGIWYFFCDFLWLFSFVHTVRRTLLTGKRDPVPRPIRASGCDGRVYLILNSLGTELFTFERKSGRNAPRTLDGARRRHAPTAHGAAEWPVAVRRTPKCKDRR
jgi:hypothetical protein